MWTPKWMMMLSMTLLWRGYGGDGNEVQGTTLGAARQRRVVDDDGGASGHGPHVSSVWKVWR